MARPVPAWQPPMCQGVAASRVAVPAGPQTTVLAFLCARFPAVAVSWPARLAQGRVLDAQGRPLAADTRCPPAGSLLWYWREPAPEPVVPFEITLLHQCADLVVVDKPHFLAVTPGGRHLQQTVLVRLRQALDNPALVPLHRLDRETAGVLLFSARAASRDAYHALLRGRQVHKVYEAVAPWQAGLVLPALLLHRLVDGPSGSLMPVQVLAGEPNAQTRIELIRRLSAETDQADPPGQALALALAHYRLLPLTGRRHQLRAQMNHLGLGIVGDRIYPHWWPAPAEGAAPDYTQPLQLLARELAFVDPLSGQPRRFASQRHLDAVLAADGLLRDR